MDTKIYTNSTKYVQKDKKARSLYTQNELTRNTLLSITKDLHVPLSARINAMLQLQHLAGPRNYIKNRCIISGRGHSVNRLFRISRLVFRKLASTGYLAGLNKASW